MQSPLERDSALHLGMRMFPALFVPSRLFVELVISSISKPSAKFLNILILVPSMRAYSFSPCACAALWETPTDLIKYFPSQNIINRIFPSYEMSNIVLESFNCTDCESIAQNCHWAGSWLFLVIRKAQKLWENAELLAEERSYGNLLYFILFINIMH